jgi:hypothetical protein
MAWGGSKRAVVIELSAKIASLCIQYSLAVKHDKAEIERLRAEK